MQYRKIKELIVPLIIGGHEYQNKDINGRDQKPKFYFSDIQWAIIFISVIVLFKLPSGLSRELVGYVIAAFSIAVSLLMSLLVSIFDKFEKIEFFTDGLDENQIVRLHQKRHFFIRFITITSYLVGMSILIIVLCSICYMFDLNDHKIETSTLTFKVVLINWELTIKNSLIILYRICLNYFLLNYLFLTIFITGSSYDFYISEIKARKISPKPHT